MKHLRQFFWPALAQGVAMLTPFLYLKAAISHGQGAALSGEVLQSIIGFGVIAIDFSASTFLARSQAKLLRSGAFASLLLGRFATAALLFLVAGALLLGQDPSGLLQMLALAMMLLGVVTEPSWISIGRGHLWVPSALSAFRFTLATFLTLSGMQPVLALGAGYLIGSLAFLLYHLGDLRAPRRLSPGLYVRIVRRYYIPTITETLTAVFSRLDVAIAALVLPVEAALVYAICRKLVVGLQSVAFSGARLFFLERDPVKLLALQRGYRRITLLVFLSGIPTGLLVAVYWFNRALNQELVLTLACLSILLVLGYKKTLIQFGQLYVHRRFMSDFLYSGMSVLGFVVLAAALTMLEHPGAVHFALVRVGADAIYLLFAIFYKPAKYEK